MVCFGFLLFPLNHCRQQQWHLAEISQQSVKLARSHAVMGRGGACHLFCRRAQGWREQDLRSGSAAFAQGTKVICA